MTILIINIDTQPQFVGGIKRVCSLLAGQWQKAGHKVCFLGFCTSPEKYGTIDGIQQIFFPDETAVATEKNSCFLKATISALHADILLNPFCDQIDMVRLVDECRKETGVRVVSSLNFAPTHLVDETQYSFFNTWKLGMSPLHWGMSLLAFTKFHLFKKRKMQHRNIRHLQTVTASSDSVVILSQFFLPFFEHFQEKHKISVINNPILLTTGNMIPKEKLIVWAGRVEFGDKRTDRMLKIWKRLAPRFPDWKLVIMGSGNITLFQELASKHRIPRVTFTGFVSNVNEWYSKASVVCVTSSAEGWSMVIAEGSSHDCVPVAYDSFSALADLIVDGQNGFRIHPFSEKEYCRKLELLMRDDKLRERMGAEARKRIQCYDVQKISQQWLLLFGKLLAEEHA